MPKAKPTKTIPQKKTSKTVTKRPIGVNVDPRYQTPKFCNYAHINVSQADKEILFTFIWVERNVEEEAKEIPAFPVGKIVMTLEHAKRFHKALGGLLEASESKK